MRALFAVEPERPEGKGLKLTYTADRDASLKHADTTPPSRLSDGRMESAPKDSVQFDGEVILTADLGARQRISRVSVMAYQRAGDFVVGAVEVSVSDDGTTWSKPVRGTNPDDSAGFEESATGIGAEVDVETRYVRLAVHPAAGAARMLLAEVVVEGPPAPPSARFRQAPRCSGAP